MKNKTETGLANHFKARVNSASLCLYLLERAFDLLFLTALLVHNG